MTRAGAPLGALLRRLPYGIGPRFRRWCETCPSIVSQLLAGGRCTSGRSPDAARVHAVRTARPRAPHQHEARNCRAPAAGFEDLFSGPASGLLHHQDASRVTPLSEQGAHKISADTRTGISFFPGSYPRWPSPHEAQRNAAASSRISLRFIRATKNLTPGPRNPACRSRHRRGAGCRRRWWRGNRNSATRSRSGTARPSASWCSAARSGR